MIYLIGSNLEFKGVKTLVLNEIKFYDFSVDLSGFEAIALTSKNSVKSLKFNRIKPFDLQVFSIGEATSKAAAEFGFTKIYTAQNAHGDEFACEIAPLAKGKKTLFLRAAQTASKVGEILTQEGVDLSQIIAYENNFKPLGMEFKPPKNSVVIFTAPSAVKNFVSNFGWDESYKAVSIGQTTSKELIKFTNPLTSEIQSVKSCVTLAKTLF